MTTKIVLTVALLATLLLAPWVTTMVLDLGKLLTMLVLAPIGFALGTSGVASILERNPR